MILRQQWNPILQTFGHLAFHSIAQKSRLVQSCKGVAYIYTGAAYINTGAAYINTEAAYMNTGAAYNYTEAPEDESK